MAAPELKMSDKWTLRAILLREVDTFPRLFSWLARKAEPVAHQVLLRTGV